MYLVKIIPKNVFYVPIDNAHNIEMHYFSPHATEIKSVQDGNNTSYLSSMDSALFATNEHVVEHAGMYQLSSFLSCDTVGFKIGSSLTMLF